MVRIRVHVWSLKIQPVDTATQRCTQMTSARRPLRLRDRGRGFVSVFDPQSIGVEGRLRVTSASSYRFLMQYSVLSNRFPTVFQPKVQSVLGPVVYHTCLSRKYIALHYTALYRI